MENKMKGWEYFEEKNVKQRFEELYEQNKTLQENMDCLFREVDQLRSRINRPLKDIDQMFGIKDGG